jgi:predicted Zn-dependent protease
MNAKDAVTYFRSEVAQRTVLRNRADVYGLALALHHIRDFDGAEKELASIRAGAPNPWIATLGADIQVGKQQWPEAIRQYRAGMQSFPQHRAFFYGYVDSLYESGQIETALAQLNERLKNVQDDARLYELAARCYERQNKRLAQHRAIAEAYFRKGNLLGAVEQMEIAVKAKDGDFYEVSSAESRLRELKLAFRNRPLMPGEKKDTPRDRDDERENRPFASHATRG